MAEIREVIRKTNVLNHPALPCLSRCHTINLLAGCPYECRYCYAQSFRSNPGDGEVLFYVNTLELLRGELPRKREKPVCVYFSTACEPFAPFSKVLDMVYDSMEFLLTNKVSILISTKSRIPERFLTLFKAHHGQVQVQIGLTMSDDRIRLLLEPKAGTVEMRLRTLRLLNEQEVSAEVRMDPLVPGLTDTDESFSGLCGRIASCGIRHAAASYLFLRKANISRMMPLSYGNWSFRDMACELYTEQITRYCGNSTIRIPDSGYRRNSYRRLKGIAGDHGIALSLCRCKNPDVTTECCHPHLPSQKYSTDQTELFD